MRNIKISALFISLAFYTACQKEAKPTNSSESETPTEEEVCPPIAREDNGKIIESRYIVELKATNTLRLASETGMQEMSKTLLRRQGIDTSLLKGSFQGFSMEKISLLQ